jgi:hypothetical protein
MNIHDVVEPRDIFFSNIGKNINFLVLTFLTFENLEKGKIHQLFKVNCHTGKDISRLSVKLKLLTGSYTTE